MSFKTIVNGVMTTDEDRSQKLTLSLCDRRAKTGAMNDLQKNETPAEKNRESHQDSA